MWLPDRFIFCSCWMAASTTRRFRIRPVVITIILVDYLILIQSSKGEEVAWLVLPAAWWLNLCTGIIDTIPRKTLAAAFNLPRPGCLRIGEIDLIREGTGVIPPSIVYLIAGFVKHFPDI